MNFYKDFGVDYNFQQAHDDLDIHPSDVANEYMNDSDDNFREIDSSGD